MTMASGAAARTAVPTMLVATCAHEDALALAPSRALALVAAGMARGAGMRRANWSTIWAPTTAAMPVSSTQPTVVQPAQKTARRDESGSKHRGGSKID
jgi:hypothetical protein